MQIVQRRSVSSSSLWYASLLVFILSLVRFLALNCSKEWRVSGMAARDELGH